MSLNNWFTQGVIVNMVTPLLMLIIAAAWAFWKAIYANKPFANPNITLTINKRAALDVITDILSLAVYVSLFIYLPPAEGRWGNLLISGVALGAIIMSVSLLVKYVKWKIAKEKRIAAARQQIPANTE